MCTALGRGPIAANGKAVLIGIHVGIGTAGNAEMLADHPCRDRKDRVRIGALCGFLAERIEELQPLLVGSRNWLLALTAWVVSTTMAMTPIGVPLFIR